jgi:hypothetical protein
LLHLPCSFAKLISPLNNRLPELKSTVNTLITMIFFRSIDTTNEEVLAGHALANRGIKNLSISSK